MNLKTIICSLILGSSLTTTAQTALTEYHPGVTAEGAVYFLPKTIIKLHVKVEKTTYKPGEFCNYAMRYLRLKDVVQEPTTSYRVLSVQQIPVAIADSSKAYSVKFNAKTVAANFSLSEDGRLLAINAEAAEPAQPELFKPASKPAATNPRNFMSEEILAAGSAAKMAELTAKEIYDLRDNRNLLIKGQADFMPSDGNQMRLMLDRLETQDRALTQLFTGITVCDTTETVFTVVPDGPISKLVAFRLSQRLGLVDSDDLSGTPFYISIEDLNTVPPVDDEAAMKVKKKSPEAGIYVNVPGKMRSTIFQGDNKFSEKEFPAPQFGNVELLSGELFNKRYTTHLWLNPLTGAVDRLTADEPK
jgi:hypothetical protein